MKEYKFNTTNYDNIEDKSVWDLYCENFRDHIWDLAPKFALNPLRVLTPEEENAEKAKAKKNAAPAKKKSESSKSKKKQKKVE